jgi:RecA-family ATPase
LSIKLDPTAPDGFVCHSFSGDDVLECRDHVRSKCGSAPFQPKTNGGRQRLSMQEMAALMREALATQRREKPRRKPVATYGYVDESGTLLYQVLKYEGPKAFCQRRPDGRGGWAWDLNGVRRVLYRLPELLQYPDATIFLCEGEKDSDRVAALGHCATTVASGRWDGVDIEPLRDRDIIILEDNDEAGRKKALAAAHALHGTAASIRIVSLPGLPEKGDVSDWLDADRCNAKRLVDVCFNARKWTPTAEAKTPAAEVKTPTAKVETPHTKNDEPSPPLLSFLKLAAWHNAPVPERAWVVRDRIPLANVALLSGEGAVGKTILSLHLAIATVLGRDWASAMPEPGPALVVACEDDADELHRRLDAIVRHYNVTFADLGDLHVASLAGKDALLATPRRDGLLAPTKLLARVQQAACDIKPRLIVLDNSADVFGGNENDRAQVRQFIGILRSLAIAANAGVLLTSHPSLTGISTGTGLSGSTAWNASVRSRLYFKRATTDKDEEPDPNLRVLEVMKNNYGPVGETITLRWKDGLFLPTPTLGSLEKLARKQKVDEAFLMLLGRQKEQGRNVSDKPKANSYAPGRFAEEPEAKADHVSKHELAEAMGRLFRANKIRSEPYGSPSRGWSRLTRT